MQRAREKRGEKIVREFLPVASAKCNNAASEHPF